MDLPNELFVQPLPTDSDTFAFNFPFQLDVKALEDGSPGELVHELDDGDLIIEGMAVSFSGVDRENENFAPGCLKEGLKAFLAGPAALCFHHKHAQVLGRVLEMEEVEGKGIRMKARVDGAIKNHPELGTIYAQIKNGTLRHLSLGGFFRRTLTSVGQRISHVDPTELSVTGVPVMADGTSFAVVAGKALEFSDDVSLQTTTVDAGPVAIIAQLSGMLDTIAKRFPEQKSVKGDPADVRFLALILKLEQASNNLATTKENGYGAEDDRVQSLGVRVKNYLDGIARETHALAAELGPLPDVNSNGEH